MTSTLLWIRDSIGYYLTSTTTSDSSKLESAFIEVNPPVDPNLIKEINALPIPDRANIKFPEPPVITPVVRFDFVIKELQNIRSNLKPVNVSVRSTKPLSDMQILLHKINENMEKRRSAILGKITI